jgi:hypothetical protein
LNFIRFFNPFSKGEYEMSSKVKWFLVLLASMLLIANVGYAANTDGDGLREQVSVLEVKISNDGDFVGNFEYVKQDGNCYQRFRGWSNVVVLKSSDASGPTETAGDLLYIELAVDATTPIAVDGATNFPIIFVDIYDDETDTPTLHAVSNGEFYLNPTPTGLNPVAVTDNINYSAPALVYTFYVSINSLSYVDMDGGAPQRYPEIGGSDDLDLFIGFHNYNALPGIVQTAIAGPNYVPAAGTAVAGVTEDWINIDTQEPDQVLGSEIVTASDGGYAGDTWTVSGCAEDITFSVDVYDPYDATVGPPAGSQGTGLNLATATFYLSINGAAATTTPAANAIQAPTGNGETVYRFSVNYPASTFPSDGAAGDPSNNTLRLVVQDNAGNEVVFDGLGGNTGDGACHNWGIAALIVTLYRGQSGSPYVG